MPSLKTRLAYQQAMARQAEQKTEQVEAKVDALAAEMNVDVAAAVARKEMKRS